jgi:hypothetical protein
VVLRLPRTDPAAPAEALTQALRAAELPFEVETIERLQTGDEAPTSTPTPTPTRAR